MNECISLARQVSVRIVCQFQGTIHESQSLKHCSSRIIVLTPATQFQKYPWFPTLWLRWCAGENALAPLLVLLFAGCGSYLPCLYPVQLSYPLARLLCKYLPPFGTGRPRTGRISTFATHECLETMTSSLKRLCVRTCADTVLPVLNNAKTFLKLNSKTCFVTHCVLAPALDYVGKGGCHHWPTLHKEQSRYSRRVISHDMKPSLSVYKLVWQCLSDLGWFQYVSPDSKTDDSNSFRLFGFDFEPLFFVWAMYLQDHLKFCLLSLYERKSTGWEHANRFHIIFKNTILMCGRCMRPQHNGENQQLFVNIPRRFRSPMPAFNHFSAFPMGRMPGNALRTLAPVNIQT